MWVESAVAFVASLARPAVFPSRLPLASATALLLSRSGQWISLLALLRVLEKKSPTGAGGIPESIGTAAETCAKQNGRGWEATLVRASFPCLPLSLLERIQQVEGAGDWQQCLALAIGSQPALDSPCAGAAVELLAQHNPPNAWTTALFLVGQNHINRISLRQTIALLGLLASAGASSHYQVCLKRCGHHPVTLDLLQPVSGSDRSLFRKLCKRYKIKEPHVEPASVNLRPERKRKDDDSDWTTALARLTTANLGEEQSPMDLEPYLIASAKANRVEAVMKSLLVMRKVSKEPTPATLVSSMLMFAKYEDMWLWTLGTLTSLLVAGRHRPVDHEAVVIGFASIAKSGRWQALLGLLPYVNANAADIRSQILYAMRRGGAWLTALSTLQADPHCYVDRLVALQSIGIWARARGWGAALHAYARCRAAGGGVGAAPIDVLAHTKRNWSLACRVYTEAVKTDRNDATLRVLLTGAWHVAFRLMATNTTYISGLDISSALVRACGRRRLPDVVSWILQFPGTHAMPELCNSVCHEVIRCPSPSRRRLLIERLLPHMSAKGVRHDVRLSRKLPDFLAPQRRGPPLPLPPRGRIFEIFRWGSTVCVWRPSHSTPGTVATIAAGLDGGGYHYPLDVTSQDPQTYAGPVLFVGPPSYDDVMITRAVYVVVCDLAENFVVPSNTNSRLDRNTAVLAVRKTSTRSAVRSVGVLEVTFPSLATEYKVAERLKPYGVTFRNRTDVTYIVLRELWTKTFVVEVTLPKDLQWFLQELLE